MCALGLNFIRCMWHLLDQALIAIHVLTLVRFSFEGRKHAGDLALGFVLRLGPRCLRSVLFAVDCHAGGGLMIGSSASFVFDLDGFLFQWPYASAVPLVNDLLALIVYLVQLELGHDQTVGGLDKRILHAVLILLARVGDVLLQLIDVVGLTLHQLLDLFIRLVNLLPEDQLDLLLALEWGRLILLRGGLLADLWRWIARSPSGDLLLALETELLCLFGLLQHAF